MKNNRQVPQGQCADQSVTAEGLSQAEGRLAAASPPTTPGKRIKRKPVSPPSNFARHDPGHCLAPGLFRSLKKGDRKKLKLEVVWSDGKGRSIKFWGPEPLGADDLRILQGLVALGCRSKTPLSLHTPEPQQPAGEFPEFSAELRDKMQPKWEALSEKAVWVETNYAALARELGLNPRSGSAIKSIRTCLERLWAVSIIAHDKGKQMGFHLLSFYSDDENSGKLFFALNPCISKIILAGQPFAYIDMREIRMMKYDITRLIHQRLCGWLSPGKTGTINIATISNYIWPDDAKIESERKRFQRAKKALQEIQELGWAVHEIDKDLYEIGRPVLVTPLRAPAQFVAAKSERAISVPDVD